MSTAQPFRVIEHRGAVPGRMTGDVVNRHGTVIARHPLGAAVRACAGLNDDYRAGLGSAVALAGLTLTPGPTDRSVSRARRAAMERRRVRALAVPAVNLFMPDDREPFK